MLRDALESVADRLRDEGVLGECLHLRRAIEPILTTVHREEEMIFPVAAAHLRTPPGLREIADQFRYEQIEEEHFAEDLCDAPRAYGMGLRKPSLETLCFMLA